MCYVCQRFLIAKRHMVLYNLNVTHRICKAYSNCNRNHREVCKVNNVVHFFLSLLTVMRYIYITHFGGLFSTCFSVSAPQAIRWKLNLTVTPFSGSHYLFFNFTRTCSVQNGDGQMEMLFVLLLNSDGFTRFV